VSIETVYLIVKADRRVRAVKRFPYNLNDDEIAIWIRLRFPDGWGRITQTLDVDVPDFTPTAEVDE
jgi:hypothetical protein